MMKMLEKKGKKKLGDHEKAAKMSVLKELKDAMSEEMGSGLKDALAAKKVSVMADSKEDLKKGLDVAKKAIGAMPGDGEESAMHEAAESAEEERAESEEGMESAESSDVDSEIAELEAKLAALKAKKGMSEEEEEESEEMEA